jgi:hypothetical protein
MALSIAVPEVNFFVTFDLDFSTVNEITEKVHQTLPDIVLPPVFLRVVLGRMGEELESIRDRDWEDFDGKP